MRCHDEVYDATPDDLEEMARHLTCIHAVSGLCVACLEEFAEDPMAFAEFGNHPAGIANFAALQAEIAEMQDGPGVVVDKSEIPF